MPLFSPSALSASLRNVGGVALGAVIFIAAALALLLSMALFTGFLLVLTVCDSIGRLTERKPPR